MLQVVYQDNVNLNENFKFQNINNNIILNKLPKNYQFT